VPSYYPKGFQDLHRVATLWAKQIEQLQMRVNPPVLKQLSETAEAINKSIGRYLNSLPTLKIDPEAIERFRRQGLPPNWWEFDGDPSNRDLVDFMRETRWCLIWVPRPEVIRDLLAADESQRSNVLLGHAEQIVDDCKSVIDTVEAGELDDLAAAAREAVDCFTAGYRRAAQALTAACLSDVIGTKFGLKFWQAREEFQVENAMKLPWIRFRQLMVFGMVADALERYHAEQGDPIPGRFSRHASAHSVSAEQFTAENALAGLLLTTAVIQEVDHQIAEKRATEAEDGAA
jgi:hypothetical protein